MDPVSIATTTASVASLCIKTIYTLSQWGHEVTGIDTALSGLRGEVESIQSVVAALVEATQGQQLGSSGAFSSVSNGRPLWAQVGRSIRDAERVLQALDKILQKFEASSSGIFSKVFKQFRMSLESGEVATLRQRLVLINSALNLPLQMLNLQIHVERAERDDGLAQVLTEKLGDMDSTIRAIHASLSRQEKAPSPSLIDDKDIYGHIKALAETAEEFASDATVVLGNVSSVGTVKAFPVGENRKFRTPSHNYMPIYGAGTQSVYGKPQPEEKHLQILNWIPPKTTNGSHEGPSSVRYAVLGGDINSLSSGMDDLEVELHGKRIAKGVSLLDDGRFSDAAAFFSRALTRMEKRSTAPEVQPLVNDVRLLLAKSLIGQKKDDEAVEVLTALVEATNGSDDAVNCSAKHMLAELALLHGDMEKAEGLCLDAAKGRRRLFGTTNTACYSSIKLLIDIYKALGEPDEVELWSSLLPPSELPRYERFILCHNEIRRLCSIDQADAAAAMGIRFLKDNYEIKTFWQWSEEELEARWTEMATNIRLGNGFAGWSAGMCVLHFLVMVAPMGADSEIEYLVRNGAKTDATFAMPDGPQGQLDWNDCTCLMLAALHGRADTVTMLLRLGAGHSKGVDADRKPPSAAAYSASAFAAAGGHFRLMQKLAAHGLGSDQLITYPNAALRYALMFDQTTIAEWLIQQAATGPYVEKAWATMMHTVAKSSSVGSMEMLVTRGERVSSQDRYGLEPIHYAAKCGTPASIACLLDNGADIEAAECWHQLTPLLVAAHEGNASCGEFLISRGAKVTALAQDGWTVLDLAVQQGHVSFVRMLIQQVPAQFESWMLQHGKSWSPVHIAVAEGRLDVLDVLLDAAPPTWEIDTPLAADENNTALDYAVSEGKQDCADMLLRHGASILSNHGGPTPIHRACSIGNIDMLRILLGALPADHTLDIPADPLRFTPLLSAIASGQLNCAKFLLQKGASVLCKDDKGWTALHYASGKGYTELLGVMISALPPDDTYLDIPAGPRDSTPLMSAAERGALSCVELLLANGALEFTRDSLSRTAAHIAAYEGHKDVLALLLQRAPWQVYDHKEARTTLVEQAVCGGQVEVLQQLLGLGVPMFHDAAVRRHGLTVHWNWLLDLIEEESTDPVPMARLLSEQYGKHSPGWKKRQDRCRGTLGAAIAASNAPLVEILLDAGFDVNAPLVDGQRPLAAAVKGGSDEVVQLLRRRGARE